MRLLLDTCTAIWLFDEHEELLPSLVDELVSMDNELFISHVSYIELAIKHSIGKLHWLQPPSEIVPGLVARYQIVELPLNAEVIFRVENLPMHHRDPFDRLLVAHAMEAGLTLVSPDPLLHPYDTPILWA